MVFLVLFCLPENPAVVVVRLTIFEELESLVKWSHSPYSQLCTGLIMATNIGYDLFGKLFF
jgi:hypothetical protein